MPEPLAGALSSRADEVSRLQQTWRAVVPEPMASHARPVRYAAGLLFIHADTAAWATRLRHQQAALVASLRRTPMLRDLAGVRLRVVPPEIPIRRPAPPTSGSRLSPKAAAVVADAARAIAHPELRAALERLATSTRKPIA